MEDRSTDADAGVAADGVAPVLVEPARQRVLTLAADLLGRLPVEDVPANLRVIARFAPTKRQRLGGVAIATTLDADETFRARVADVLVAGAPDLVAAVRDGTSTAASDPIDVAVVAYLTRPPTWTATMAEANRRWGDQRDASVSGADEITALRAELAQLRADARGEPQRLSAAIEIAVAEVEAERAKLRRNLGERTRELRSAEQARERAEDETRTVRESAAGDSDARDSELRRLRERVEEAERAAEAVRRAARTERDIDDARLWLLVDTIVAAAGGVRRELALPAPSVRPADGVGSAGVSDRMREVRDSPGLDRLLALPHVHLMVDGYNVTKTGYGELPLVEQRTRLIGSLAPLAAQSGAEITIAFDGSVKPPAQPATPRGVRVLFSAADEIADDLIRRLVAAEPAGRAVVVVTSDRQVVSDVTDAGAWAVPSAVLLTRLG